MRYWRFTNEARAWPMLAPGAGVLAEEFKAEVLRRAALKLPTTGVALLDGDVGVGGLHVKHWTLTQIAALPDGLYGLYKCARWCGKKEDRGLKQVAVKLVTAFGQAHLAAAMVDVKARDAREGKRIGKAKYARKCAEQETAGRQVEYGLFR